MKISGVAIVGRQNEPLLLRTSEAQPPCEPIEHIIYAALDVVDDHALLSAKKSTPDALKFYLGALYPLEDGKCYGYLVNTKIKFFIITQSQAHSDQDVQSIFQQLHSEYVRMACSPFFKQDAPITSAKYVRFVDSLLASGS
ncbi:hypothetical protein PTSG_08753 [Salpingoeca rosetta]|uniref:Trafficking protein particle complex subunit 2-like protein n=1 Tax=Salpingoeca rosetta (strain ATCC 50818 / BSB-021) TaxID=946362 RepID=F2UKL2_SALR5|nr:uncharacterized protein PTSG_08753 [Salpingoeca rosetta]EGD77661.1 hypothetical protein PTSG_08753 [Salpingoeca rosetta]|eukprot:XP_004990137.1 hypothetical protein PTSG_08753 [Salpingoeca rosetta]